MGVATLTLAQTISLLHTSGVTQLVSRHLPGPHVPSQARENLSFPERCQLLGKGSSKQHKDQRRAATHQGRPASPFP